MAAWLPLRRRVWRVALGLAGVLGCAPAMPSIGQQQAVSYGQVSARSSLRFHRFRNALPGGIPVSLQAASGEKLAVGYLGGTLAICSIEKGPIDAILPPWRMVVDPGRAAVIAKVKTLATDGKGKAIVALSDGGQAWHWDIDRGNATQLPDYGGLVAVAIDRTGRFAAAAALSGRLVLWDLAAAETVVRAMARGSRVSALSFVDPRRIVVCHQDGQLSVWRPGSAPETKLLLPHGVARAWQDAMAGRLLLSDEHGQVSLVTIGLGEAMLLERWSLPAAPLDLVESDDGWYAAGWAERSQGGNGIAVYRLMRGQQAQKVTDIKLQGSGYKTAAFVRGGQAIALARADGVIEVFNVATGELSSVLRPDLDAPLAVAPGKDGLLGVVYRRSLAIWDLRTGKITHRKPVALRSSVPDACLVRGDHPRLFVADADRLIDWHPLTSRISSTRLWADSSGSQTRIATDAGGQFLLSWSLGEDRGPVVLWTFHDGKWREQMRAQLDHPTGTVAPSGVAALVSGFDGRYVIWPLRRSDLPQRGKLAREAPVYVQFVDGHSKLLAVHLDCSVSLLELRSRRLLKNLRLRPEIAAASQAVMWASAAPGGTHIVAVCMDGRVYAARLHSKTSVWELLPAGFAYPLSPAISDTGLCYLITENAIEVWKLRPARPTFCGILVSLRQSSTSRFQRFCSVE